MIVVGVLEAAHASANVDAALQLLIDRFPYDFVPVRGIAAALERLARELAGVGVIGMLMLPTAAIVIRGWRGTRTLLWSLWVLLLAGQLMIMYESGSGLILSGTRAGTPEAAVEPLLKLPGLDWFVFTPQVLLFVVLYRMYRLILADETETFLAARKEVPDDPAWVEGMQAIKARRAERAASTSRGGGPGA
ncbi:hypothetical protein AB0M47_19625 [Hamadaea sp. NPDC051192]|uniref:hypothetical protein n=1 Tax=Hamadaea sp. NPDC051192 TaxID=3154940 RepID=UPI003433352C